MLDRNVCFCWFGLNEMLSGNQTGSRQSLYFVVAWLEEPRLAVQPPGYKQRTVQSQSLPYSQDCYVSPCY